MKYQKLILALGLGGAVALFSGCATSPYYASIYTGVEMPITATAASSDSSKQGNSECLNILGIIATGNCSIDSAAKNGNIKTIKSVDTKVVSFLGIFAKATTIVKGD